MQNWIDSLSSLCPSPRDSNSSRPPCLAHPGSYLGLGVVVWNSSWQALGPNSVSKAPDQPDSLLGALEPTQDCRNILGIGLNQQGNESLYYDAWIVSLRQHWSFTSRVIHKTWPFQFAKIVAYNWGPHMQQTWPIFGGGVMDYRFTYCAKFSRSNVLVRAHANHQIAPQISHIPCSKQNSCALDVLEQKQGVQ